MESNQSGREHTRAKTKQKKMHRLLNVWECNCLCSQDIVWPYNCFDTHNSCHWYCWSMLHLVPLDVFRLDLIVQWNYYIVCVAWSNDGRLTLVSLSLLRCQCVCWPSANGPIAEAWCSRTEKSNLHAHTHPKSKQWQKAGPNPSKQNKANTQHTSIRMFMFLRHVQ